MKQPTCCWETGITENKTNYTQCYRVNAWDFLFLENFHAIFKAYYASKKGLMTNNEMKFMLVTKRQNNVLFDSLILLSVSTTLNTV